MILAPEDLAREHVATLIAHAEGREPHAGAGMCPDSVEGHETRDSECSVCRALAALSSPASSAGMDAQRLDFDQAARPLIKWLSENVHPHHTAIVTNDSAELLEGKQTVRTAEYVND